jgi:thiamine pyrophosphokinase
MQKQKYPRKKQQNDFTGAYRYANLGFQMLIIILIGTFGGRKLDKKLLLDFPVFTLTFSLLAIAIALYSVIKNSSNKK